MLVQQLDEEIKSALRSKNTRALNVLRMLKSSINNTIIENSGEPLSEQQIIGLIRREIKKRDESKELYIQGNRPELATVEEEEVKVLEQFLPKQITPEELNIIVLRSIAAVKEDIKQYTLTKKDMGKVMKFATAIANGAVDGKTLSTAVQAALA